MNFKMQIYYSLLTVSVADLLDSTNLTCPNGPVKVFQRKRNRPKKTKNPKITGGWKDTV